jgi:hypothetical protein
VATHSIVAGTTNLWHCSFKIGIELCIYSAVGCHLCAGLCIGHIKTFLNYLDDGYLLLSVLPFQVDVKKATPKDKMGATNTRGGGGSGQSNKGTVVY